MIKLLATAAFGFGLAAPSGALRPCAGGGLELSGVFGGRPSLAARSAAPA